MDTFAEIVDDWAELGHYRQGIAKAVSPQKFTQVKPEGPLSLVLYDNENVIAPLRELHPDEATRTSEKVKCLPVIYEGLNTSVTHYGIVDGDRRLWKRVPMDIVRVTLADTLRMTITLEGILVI